MPQANSTMSMPRVDFALGVGEHLAVLGGDGMGQLVACGGSSSSRNLNMTRARRIGGVSAQAGKAAWAAGDGGSDFGRVGQGDLAGDRAGGGVEDVLAAAGGAGHDAAGDEVVDRVVIEAGASAPR